MGLLPYLLECMSRYSLFVSVEENHNDVRKTPEFLDHVHSA